MLRVGRDGDCSLSIKVHFVHTERMGTTINKGFGHA